jgi:hypothetical protein
LATFTFYRTWKDNDNPILDGTNNADERAIGWWVEERYRTMAVNTIDNGERKVRRLAERECSRHSRLGANSVSAILREQGVANFLGKARIRVGFGWDGNQVTRSPWTKYSDVG